jgi:hypothetical protein
MKLIKNYPKIIIYEDQSYKKCLSCFLPSLVIEEMLIITCDVRDGSIHAINNEMTMTYSRR